MLDHRGMLAWNAHYILASFQYRLPTTVLKRKKYITKKITEVKTNTNKQDVLCNNIKRGSKVIESINRTLFYQ